MEASYMKISDTDDQSMHMTDTGHDFNSSQTIEPKTKPPKFNLGQEKRSLQVGVTFRNSKNLDFSLLHNRLL